MSLSVTHDAREIIDMTRFLTGVFGPISVVVMANTIAILRIAVCVIPTIDSVESDPTLVMRFDDVFRIPATVVLDATGVRLGIVV